MKYRNFLAAILTGLFILALLGCQDSGPSQSQIETNTNETANDENSANTEPPAIEKHRIKFESYGKVEIVGKYYGPSKLNSPALILLHQWQSNRKSYEDFAKQMHLKGFGVLAIDGRGFGESVRTTDGKLVPVSRTDEAVKAMKADVRNAYEFLTKQINVDPERIGIVGASYGSSIGLMYAVDNKKVKALAMLSPGLNYFGNMPIEPAVKNYGDRPLLLVASEDDKAATNSVKKLKEVGANERYEMKIYPKGGHGTTMFVLKTGVEDVLEEFFTKNL